VYCGRIHKMPSSVSYRKVTPRWVKPLRRFFREIEKKKESKYFHPHPLSDEGAKEIAAYQGQDLYFLQVKGNTITGYAMLRGWDEGFSVPSLGIAIHPGYRRQGLAKQFLAFMHRRAKEKGADKIRLSVYTDNVSATRLYRSFGYCFGEEKDNQVIGFYEL